MTPRRHFKCRLPSLRPRRLTEGFSTDTFFASTRSARGNTCMQVFLGVRSGYTLAIPLKSKAYAYTALQDYIRTVGAPLFLISDSAKEENLGEWITICRTFGIPKHSSEPYYQHQNKVERRIQDIERHTLYIMRIHLSRNVSGIMQQSMSQNSSIIPPLVAIIGALHMKPYMAILQISPFFASTFMNLSFTSTRLPLFSYKHATWPIPRLCTHYRGQLYFSDSS